MGTGHRVTGPLNALRVFYSNELHGSGRVPASVGAMQSLAPAFQHAIEKAGVEFTNGGEPGVKLRR
jgi:hypothetical protein